MSIKTNITREDYVAFVRQVARSLSAANGERTVRMFIAITLGFGIGLALSLVHVSSFLQEETEGCKSLGTGALGDRALPLRVSFNLRD
jgi:hypothetical protein